MLLTMNSPSFLINTHTHKKIASYFHVCCYLSSPFHKQWKGGENWWYVMKYKFRNTDSEKL